MRGTLRLVPGPCKAFGVLADICGCLCGMLGECCARPSGPFMKKRYLKLVRHSFKALRHRRLRHRPWWRTLSRPLLDRNLWIPCRDSVANGLAFGLFFSVMLMPFQSLPPALLAMRFRANVPFAMAATWISNPFTTPAILFGQFRLGQWMHDTLRVPMPEFLSAMQVHAPGVGTLNAGSFILGMITSGILLALCAYPVVHLFAAILPHHLPIRTRRSRAAKPVVADTEANLI